ncbi:hypothetical protein BH09MYX1_BH09MYX1_06250 [soil metagenome]
MSALSALSALSTFACCGRDALGLGHARDRCEPNLRSRAPSSLRGWLSADAHDGDRARGRWRHAPRAHPRGRRPARRGHGAGRGACDRRAEHMSPLVRRRRAACLSGHTDLCRRWPRQEATRPHAATHTGWAMGRRDRASHRRQPCHARGRDAPPREPHGARGGPRREHWRRDTRLGSRHADVDQAARYVEQAARRPRAAVAHTRPSRSAPRAEADPGLGLRPDGRLRTASSSSMARRTRCARRGASSWIPRPDAVP